MGCSFPPGHRQEYTLNATGATENFNTFASIGYLKEKGYLLQTDFERYTGRINSNLVANKYLKVGVNLSGAIQKGNQNDNAGTSYTSNPFYTDQYSPIFPYYKHNEETVNSSTLQKANPNGMTPATSAVRTSASICV